VRSSVRRFFLFGHVMPHGTASGGADQAVMAGNMTADAAHSGAFDTARGF
jgi:hypothetical protein